MKTILITGANRGIGLGLALHYLDAGWLVLITSRCELIELPINEQQKSNFTCFN